MRYFRVFIYLSRVRSIFCTLSIVRELGEEGKVLEVWILGFWVSYSVLGLLFSWSIVLLIILGKKIKGDVSKKCVLKERDCFILEFCYVVVLVFLLFGFIRYF